MNLIIEIDNKTNKLVNLILDATKTDLQTNGLIDKKITIDSSEKVRSNNITMEEFDKINKIINLLKEF